MAAEHTPQEELMTGSRRKRGQLLFALGFFVLSIVLLALIGEQTQWKAKTRLFAQPAFWPAVSLAVMVVFGGFHLRSLKRHRFAPPDWIEGKIWLQPLEYALWFMIYVAAVPIVGFLISTILFAVFLVWRMGYRTRQKLWLAAAFAASVVVIFKGFLSVRIPGGMIYEWLPGAIRNFFILNF